MLSARNFIAAQAQWGRNLFNQSWKDLDRVISALKEKGPVTDMTVTLEEGKRVPLDQYLATVRQITEADNFFTGEPLFDIWTNLPRGLTNYPDKLGVSSKEAQELLYRFNAYTWNEVSGLRSTYMDALRKTLWVPEKWNALYHGTPNLNETINNVILASEFRKVPSISKLKKANHNVMEIESKVDKIPPEKLSDLFTPEGWITLRKRKEMAFELQPKLKESAKRLLEPLTKVGAEYRMEHINSYYSSLDQLQFP